MTGGKRIVGGRVIDRKGEDRCIGEEEDRRGDEAGQRQEIEMRGEGSNLGQ